MGTYIIWRWARGGLEPNRRAIRTRRILLTVLLALGGRCLGSAAELPETIQKIQQLLQKGDLASAQILLSQALRESPDSGELYDFEGVIKAQENDFFSAEANFRKALKLAPHLEGAYLNLGRLYQEHMTNDPNARDKALGVYAALLKFSSGDQEANYQSAVLLMQKGFYAPSLQYLDRLPAEAQEHSQGLSVRCGDYAGLGEGDKAARAVDQILQSADLVEADVTSILPILATKKYTALALSLLQGLESRRLASVHSLYSLGSLYEEAGRLEEARSTFEAAAQLQPNSVPTLIALAQVANRQKDYPGALGYLAHARELEPINASIHFFWGIVCIDQNLWEEAYESLKKAVALDPNNAYYNYAMGVATMQRANAGESIPYLQKYCQLKPHDPHGRLALGAAYFNSKDEEQAEKVLSGWNDSQTSAVANFYLARIADHKGRHSEAIQDLELAIKARPSYADGYAELGIIYLNQRDYHQAEKALHAALKLDPDNYLGNLNLTILYKRTNNPKAEEQERRFEQVKQEKAQQAKEFMRIIEVRPLEPSDPVRGR